MSTQSNQQLSRYVFSIVIEYWEQNVPKQIDCNRPLLLLSFIYFSLALQN